MGRRHAEEFLELLRGKGFAQPNPRPMFPNPPGLLRLEPYSEGLRDRIWWGSATNATAAWAAKLGMNLQTSTLKFDETGEPLHIQQAAQIRAFRAAWKEAGHARTPRVSVSRSIFALLDDRDRAYFGRGGQEKDQIGFLDETTRAIFGRSYAAEPDVLIEQLRKDEAIAEADTFLLTVPNQLGVAYNAHVMEAILTTSLPRSVGAESPMLDAAGGDREPELPTGSVTSSDSTVCIDQLRFQNRRWVRLGADDESYRFLANLSTVREAEMFGDIDHLRCCRGRCRSRQAHERPSRNGRVHHHTGSLACVVGFRPGCCCR